MSAQPKPNPSGSQSPIDRAASILAKLVLKKRKPVAEAAKDLEYTGSKKAEAEKNFDKKRKEVLEAFQKKAGRVAQARSEVAEPVEASERLAKKKS